MFKYGKNIKNIFMDVEKIVKELSKIEIPGCGCGGKTKNVFKMIRMKSIIENLRNRIQILSKII